jgi:hypothetical protein
MPAGTITTSRSAQSQPSNVTAAGIGVPDIREEIERRAKEMAAEMVGSGALDIYEIVAPVGDPKHEVWDHLDASTGRIVHRYSQSTAAVDGTFNIHVPEHEVWDQGTKKRVARVPAQVIPMFSGVARTRDRYAAEWVATNFGYVVKKIENNAPIGAE